MIKAKRLMAVLLLIALVFSLSGCGLLDVERLVGKFIDYSRNGGTSFSDMEYVRPEAEDLRSCADSICAMLDGGSDYDDVADALDEFYVLYWSFYTMKTLADIRSDLDTSDEFYIGEYEYCATAEADVSTIFTELMVSCADSALSSELDENYFGGMLAANYSGGYDSGFEALNGLYLKESELLTRYRSLLVEFSACRDMTAAYRDFNEDIGEIYIDLVKNRHAIARELGFESYEELAYYQFGREYTPDDLEDYLAAIREYLVPVFKAAYESGVLDEAYEALYGIDADEALQYVLKQAVADMSPRLESAMSFMLKYGLYDVEYSPTKLDASYVIYIDDYNSPFLFVNPQGYEGDVLTIAHEFGHFCDSYENFDLNYNLDTSETLSQGMEYLVLSYLQDEELAEDLIRFKMTDTLYLYMNQACFNEFEHRVFSLPENELTVNKVNSIYAECAELYCMGAEYGAEDVGLTWIDVSHFFDYPFYVVSYCVSDTAAFSLYDAEYYGKGAGLEAYLRILEDAENLDFLELLDEAGLGDIISADSVKSIAETISDRLGLN
ncbi:MAG: hypothetical protein HUJ66_00465 [Oscillospiraceae bacterium]|nr:hypothetical protein [Oscillospiraceae bacterium]